MHPSTSSRSYPDSPILGVGALIFQNGLLLLIERGQEPYRGYWSLPGGVLETGETLDQGIRREVLEETGLQIEPIRVFEIFERIVPDAQGRIEHHYVLVDHLCRVISGVAAPASDVSALAWVSQPELSGYRLTEGTLAVVERAFHDQR